MVSFSRTTKEKNPSILDIVPQYVLIIRIVEKGIGELLSAVNTSPEN